MDVARIAYDRTGSGTPVVLLHGLAHRRQTWYPVMRNLAHRHEAIALDLPGCGSSPDPPEGERYDVAALAETVRRFCAELGVDRPHVVGNSLGGAVALELGACGFAASATALSPVGFNAGAQQNGHRLLAQSATLASLLPQRLWRAAAGSRPGRAVARRALRGDPSSHSARGLVFDTSVLTPGSPFLRMLPRVADYTFTGTVPCPVTVAWGDRDRLLPPGNARRALNRIPHARQVTLLRCGHIPMSDNPRAVAHEILQTCHEADSAGTVGTAAASGARDPGAQGADATSAPGGGSR
ncbi:alpha/beta fold hydrolase [Haloactinospora alba]|nr:alpha/beta hydrolase [Haloactinospora alba]